MQYVSFRPLSGVDAHTVSQLLLDGPPNYTRFFRPFDFNPVSIRSIMEKAVKDRFFGLELKSQSSHYKKLVAFYMLRGLDEGYKDPMYGVFVSHLHKNRGLAKIILNHAECFCKYNGYDRILLKVFPENVIAKHIYENSGFNCLGIDKDSGQSILCKEIQNRKKHVCRANINLN